MDRGPRERLRARSEVRVRVFKFKRVDTEQRRVNFGFGAQMEARPRGKGLVGRPISNGSRPPLVAPADGYPWPAAGAKILAILTVNHYI